MRKTQLFCWPGVCLGLQLLSSVTAYSRDGFANEKGRVFFPLPSMVAVGAGIRAVAADEGSGAFVAGPVTGSVTSAEGKPLEGVTVTVKGTPKATITDAAGHFTIDANKGDVLVFSYIGYVKQEIKAGDGNMSVALVASNAELSTVVVTALGIKKQARSLGYSTTEVDGSKFTQSREANIGDALTGQVAGVSVAGVATGPSGSSRVIIRGNASLGNNNQPLYVIDGIPYDNTNQGMATKYGGEDQGDGLTNINPDDIESIQVLKGVAASALYGYRGGNGAILITTKSGAKSKGVGVEVNNNFTVTSVHNLTDYQYQYGEGLTALKPTTAAAAQASEYFSWGAPLDGSQAVNFLGNNFNYSPYKNNFSDFYKDGPVNQSSVALTGSNDQGHFRLGLSDLYNGTVIPNSNMQQQGMNFNSEYHILPKLTINLTANYVFEEVKNRVSFSDAPGNVVASTLYLPNSFHIKWLAPNQGTNGSGSEQLPGTDPYFDNPYFVAYKFQNATSRQRLTGGLTLKYDFTNWLFAQGGVTRDGYDFDLTNVVPSGTGYAPGGQITTEDVNFHELNWNYLIGVHTKFGSDFTFNANVGGNSEDNVNSSSDVLSAGPFNVPYFYSLSNVTTRPITPGYARIHVNSVYGTADLGYKNFLFLNLTGRDDWFSTLAINNDRYLYPSGSLSFVFSDALRLPNWISFGKLRISDAEASNGTGAYLNSQTYGFLGYGIDGQSQSFILQNVVPNPNLGPVQISEKEAGANMQFLNNRVGFDVAVYEKTTTKDIVPVTISPTSGYDGDVENIGKIQNKGVELLLTGTPVRTRDFSWNVTFNIGINNSKTVYIGPGIPSIVISGANARWGNGVNISNWVGLPYGQITGLGYKKDANGNKIFSDGSDGLTAGEPEPTTSQVPLGSGVYKQTGGLSNDFHYKNFSVAFLIDFKYGAKMYSGTNLLLYYYGLQKTTLQGRGTPGYIGKGVDLNGHPNTVAVNSQLYFQDLSTGNDQIAQEFVYDASFIKLRSLSVTYSLPASMIRGTVVKGVNVALVARNLAILMKHTPNEDPESNYGTGNGQGLELSGYPSTRSLGLNVNVKF
jgi:TonB-linked SusC/RagA family outer membrane protein